MRGYLYYALNDIKRNQAFIDELINEAKQYNIQLKCVHEETAITKDAQFVIYRGRDYKLVQRLEQKGIRVFNRSEVSRIANNKLSTFELAMMLGIPVIETHKLYTSKQIDRYTVVIKTTDGFGGQDVHLCQNEADVLAVQQQYKDKTLIVQPYIESNATDIRIFALGNEIIGAVKRQGQQSFKANFSLGGKIESYQPTKRDRLIIEKITSALHSDYIGVDFLQQPNGQLVLNEIEDPVGARSLYITENISVAERYIDYIYCQLTKTN